MSKSSILWHSINTLLILCLYFWMVFSIGNQPKLEQDVVELTNQVEKIDYLIQHKSDTVIINNYFEITSKK